jgi:hypothetical protein
MLLKKNQLNKELSFGQKNSNLGYTSLMNYSSSKENKPPFPTKNELDLAHLEELLHVLECLIRLEDKFSLKDNKSKSFDMVKDQITLAVILLHRENVGLDIILKHLLDESKLLNLHVNDMDLAMDMLKTVKKLEFKYVSLEASETGLNVLLARLYNQLKAATA